MNSCHIRQATLSDIPEMHHLISVAMTQYAKDSAIPTLLDALLETEEDLKGYVLQDHFLLAFQGGKLAGTLRISNYGENSRSADGAESTKIAEAAGESNLTSDFSPKTAYISRFAVDPSIQKLGVGSALFNQADEYLKACGYQRIVLHTALTNAPLVRFYMKRKFKLNETQTDRGYPRGTFVRDYSADSKKRLS